jgi:catechol 2,3-dioxygenase-like lactoylglutathione lyase family enzyme
VSFCVAEYCPDDLELLEIDRMADLHATFDVGGVLLERPFKIRRLGHFGVNVVDSGRNVEFYTDLLGFKISDSIDFSVMLPEARRGDDLGCPLGFFLRHGTDHHSYVVFPKAVFEAVTAPAPPQVTANQLTWQVGSLREVRDAIDWLPTVGCPVMRAGRDMPGSNWHVYVPDPDGHISGLEGSV